MLREQDARTRLDILEFPPLSVTPLTGESGPGDADWMLELRWKDQTFRFAVEYRNVATPLRMEEAIGRARRLEGESVRPMVMAPFLSEEALGRLIEEEMSGIDFSGNGVVVVPGQWFVYRSGAENRYPSSAPIKAIYDGTSSLVGRVFLRRTEYALVKNVREEILSRGGSISLGTVSKVLKGLEEDLVIARGDAVQLLQPDRLLDALAEGYSPPRVRRRVLGRSEDDPLKVVSDVASRSDLSVAVRGDSRYIPFPGAEQTRVVYCTDAEALLECGGVTENARFPNIEILETDDQRVYFDLERGDGAPWTSPVQTYLDLMKGGKREREVAEQLRSLILERR